MRNGARVGRFSRWSLVGKGNRARVRDAVGVGFDRGPDKATENSTRLMAEIGSKRTHNRMIHNCFSSARRKS